jgi:hypothetical protein
MRRITMHRFKLSPKLIGKTEWVSGNTYEDMNGLSHLSLQEDGRVLAVFTDDSTLDVTELFPAAIIDSYRSHDILIKC